MTSKNSISHIAPVNILPNPSSMSDYSDLEFKSCHNRGDTNLNNEDVIFLSAHSRDPREKTKEVKKQASRLFEFKERAIEDQEFFSVHNNHHNSNHAQK